MVKVENDLLQELPIESLFIAHSYRLKDDPDADLIESVRAEGVRLPLIVRPAEPFGYEVVAGRRRFLAAKSAGLTSVPAIVRPLSDSEAREMEIAENLGRKSFAPPELARAVLDRTLGDIHPPTPPFRRPPLPPARPRPGRPPRGLEGRVAGC